MPKGTKYRYKKGTKIRLALLNGEVIEAKNTKTGATHTKEEFEKDASRKRKKRAPKSGGR